MIGGMRFEVMKSSNAEFGWKTVTKRRRTRKAIARSMNCVAKEGNSLSPSRVGDFMGSDSDKFGVAVTGQSSSVKSESVPIKKRNHLIQALSPHTWTPSDHSEHEYNDLADFSGIELLAAAASMDNESDNTKNADLDVGHSLTLKTSNANSSASQCELGLERVESESSMSVTIIVGNATSSPSQCELGLKSGESESSVSLTTNVSNTDHSLVMSNLVIVSQCPCEKSVDMMTMPKVDRRHWDLNTLMDTWDDPYNGSIAGNTSNNMSIEDMKKDSSNTAQVVSDQATEKDTSQVNPDLVPVCDTCKDTSDQFVNIDAMVNISPLSKLYSRVAISKEKINTISVNDAMNKGEACFSYVSESERTTSSVNQAATQDIKEHPTPTSEISETAIDIQCKDIRDSLKACEPPGATIQDGLSVLPCDLRIQSDGTFASHSMIADIQGQVEPVQLVAKHDGYNLPNEGSRRTALDSCKSSVAPVQCGVDPSSSPGKIGSFLDALHDPDVPQNHNFRAVDEVGLTKCQDAYDSPYEDGELRGSYLYSWEDNELEDECIDYESDGRNGDGSDAADYTHSGTVEGGSEGLYGDTPRRNLFAKQLHDNGNKSGSVKQNLSMHVVKDGSGNNEIAGKGSTAGSGTTVEEPIQMDIKKSNDTVKRHLTDERDNAQPYKYASKTVRGKLQSRIKGWSSLDPTDGKAFHHECSSPRFRLFYSQPERCTYPGKNLGTYRPSAHGERGGVHHSTSRSSKRKYSSFQGAEGRSYIRPRNITRNSDEMGGLGFHDPRQMINCLPECLHRPFVRSPDEGDDYFGVWRRRMPTTRGGHYRGSRRHYLHHARTDFVEHLESLPDEANIPVQLSCYLSTRERSFSPNSGRIVHMPSQCKRSRSKSRTCSPGPWHHSRRELFLSTRRYSRSPYFRSEAQMDRTRVAFQKPSVANDCEEGYISPSRGRLSHPRCNYRWVDDGSYADNHSGHRRPLVRKFRRT